MSAGTPVACEGRATAGVPVPPERAWIIGRLEAEARQARGAFEWARAAELEAQIRQLSAGTADNPSKETTDGHRAGAERTAAAPRARRGTGRKPPARGARAGTGVRR